MSYIGNNPKVNSVNYSESFTLAQIQAITSPKEGMQMYANDENKMYYYDGTTWVELGSTPSGGSVALQPIHYGYASGSAGSSVAMLDDDSGGTTFTVTELATGRYQIQWAAINHTFTEDVCFIPRGVNNAQTSDEFGCYLESADDTTAIVITTVNRIKTALDFCWIMSPQGADAPAQSGQTVYTGIINANNTLKSENVAGIFSLTARPSPPTSGNLVYNLNWTLTPSDIIHMHGNFADPTASSDAKKFILADQTTGNSQLQINDYDGGDPYYEYDVHFCMVLGNADDPETVVSSSKWLSARNERASTIVNENVTGAFDSVTYSVASSTFDFSSAGLTTFISFATGWNDFNNGDGGTRHFYNQDFSTGSSTATASEGNNSSNATSNGFTRINMLILPTGADNRF